MQEMHRTTDETVSQSGRRKAPLRPSRRALVLVVLALVAAGVLAVVLRKGVAEYAIRQHCRSKALACSVRVATLDAGRVVIESASVTDNDRALASLDRVEMTLSWSSLFSPGLRSATISGLDLAVNATGEGDLLGALGALAPTGAASTDGSGDFPELQINEALLHVQTPGGVVDLVVDGDVRDAQNLSLDFKARPAELALDGRRLSLKSGQGRLRLAGAAVEGDGELDIAALSGEGVDLEAVRLVVSASQAGGPLRLQLDGTAGRSQVGDIDISDAVIRATAQSRTRLTAAAQPDALVRDLIGGLRELDAEITIAAGRRAGVEGRSIRTTAHLEPDAADDALTGAILVSADALVAANAATGRSRLALDVERFDPATWDYRLRADLRATDASVDRSLSREMAARLVLPAILDPLDKALEAVLVEAATRFDVQAPVRLSGRGLDTPAIETVDPIMVTARNGASVTFTPLADGAGAGGKRVSGRLVARAGPAVLNVGKAVADWSGPHSALDLQGVRLAAALESGEQLALTLAAPRLAVSWTEDGMVIVADEPVDLDYTGHWQGLDFSEVRLVSAFSAQRKDDQWTLSAPGGARLGFQRIDSRWIKLGPVRTTLQLDQPIRTGGQGRLQGGGVTGGIDLPFSVGSRDYTLKMAKLAFDLSDAPGAPGVVTLGLDKPDLAMDVGFGPVRLSAPSVPAVLKLGQGWSISGNFSKAAGSHDLARIESLAGAFSLKSGASGLAGQFDDITFRMRDSQSPARWAAMDYAGAFVLQSGRVSGDGDFTHPLFPAVRASTRLTHDLGSGNGALVILPSEVRFSPKGAQPAAMFPILRGVVANVSGAVMVSGEARWGEGGFTTGGVLDLTDVGFASGKAGVFSGVFGTITLTDIIHVQSPPGQELQIHEWNPGVPLEAGLVQFQLDGLDQVRLEQASFPWVGGRLVAKPMNWQVNGDINTVLVDAEGLDLADMVKRFGIPKTEASGVLTGVFPVEFATGAVRIRNAELSATNGRLAYLGDPPGDQETPNASVQLMFNALKDFRFEVLKVGLDGDIAGEMTLSMDLLGHNPAVLDGYPFDLNITATAELLPLLSMNRTGQRELERISRLIAEQRQALAGQ